MTGAVPLDDIDLSDLRFWMRPHRERVAAFAALRAQRPIAFFDEPDVPGTSMEFPKGAGYYALTRHRDVATASRRPEVFLSGPGAISPFDLPPEMVEYFSGLVSSDDPKHARRRRIVSNAFNPRHVAAIEDSIERVAADVVARALDAGTGDFVADLAAPLPLEIICSMMGVPTSEHATVLRASNVIFSMGDPEVIGPDADSVVALLEAGATLTAIMEDLGRFRRVNPVDDITSALVNAEVESERLTQQELSSFFVELVTAGNETTRTAITHALIALSDHPAERARLLAGYEGLARTFVDEVVRWSTPVNWMRRTLAEDFTLSGVDLKAGDKVLMFYCSANRDEDVFEDPDRFDVGRTPNDHYGFGAPGPHFCLGAHLARREIAVLWRVLLARAPQVHATGEPSPLASNFVNGVKRLGYAFD